MKIIGKKTKEWLAARKTLIAELKKTGEYQVIGTKVYGICKDCWCYKPLTPDHKIRRSQGGSHKKKNIDWVCLNCHIERDQMGDPNKKKPKSKKADWQKAHDCKFCKGETAMLICHRCGKMSI